MCYRVPFKFSMIGLKAGDEVVFDATKLTVKIANDDEVEYQGVKYSTSNFVRTFMPEDMKDLDQMPIKVQCTLPTKIRTSTIGVERPQKVKVALNLALDAMRPTPNPMPTRLPQ